MIKNNKGFMLAEVIITSTIIVTAMVGLYSSLQKLYVGYNEKNNYYNVDGVYATRLMINHLFELDFNEFINYNLKTITDSKFNLTSDYYLIKDGTCTLKVDGSTDTICEALATNYKIQNMIFVEYDVQVVNNLSIENETFKEYVDYVTEYYDIKNANTGDDSSDDSYRYLFLTEIYDGEDYYYSNLRVR